MNVGGRFCDKTLYLFEDLVLNVVTGGYTECR